MKMRKPKQNSSKTKAAPPTRKSDIFIGVDEVVDDDGEDLDEIRSQVNS